jgi:hypothetical protein
LASASDHLIQAKSNEELVGLLATTAHPDWRCTVIYYASLHYLEAYFKSHSSPLFFTTHTARNKAIQSDPRLREIHRFYRRLEDWSRLTRYELRKPDPGDFDTELLPHLRRIKEHLKPYVPGIDVS